LHPKHWRWRNGITSPIGTSQSGITIRKLLRLAGLRDPQVNVQRRDHQRHRHTDVKKRGLAVPGHDLVEADRELAESLRRAYSLIRRFVRVGTGLLRSKSEQGSE